METLVPGDLVCTADGCVSEMRWLGRETVSAALNDPAKVNPIRIRAGALGAGLPQRDLFVSADHAVGLDGYLINAGALLNGTSITRAAQMPSDGFTYYHVGTDAHELILAEGCAAETYLDMPSRENFDNGAERADAPQVAEMAMPRITVARLLPHTIKAQLADRADVVAPALALAS